MSIIFFWGLFTIIGALIGSIKSRVGMGLFLGFLLGPFGWLIMALMKSHKAKCPYCGGIIEEGYGKCKHCGSELFGPSSSSADIKLPKSKEKPQKNGPSFYLKEESKRAPKGGKK